MKTFNIVIVIVSVAIVLIVANVLAGYVGPRFDLTQHREYTLSAATRDILKELDDIVTVRVYFTEKLPPQLLSLRRSVDDLLSEFKRAAGQKLQIEYRDPGGSALEEQKAELSGIPPVEVGVLEADRQEVTKVYLGMVVLYGDKEEVLPVVQRVDNLEYTLAEALLKVSMTEMPKIGWWAFGDEDDSSPREGYRVIRELLARRYTIVEIDPARLSDIDVKNIKALIIVNPKAMENEHLFAIDQFLMNGGRTAILLNRWNIAPGLQAQRIETKLLDLLTHYGVTVDDAFVLDQSNATAAFTGGIVTYHLPYPYWPLVRRNGFAAEVPMVSELEALVLPWTSPLMLAPKALSPTTTVLAKTSPAGVIVSGNPPPRLDPQESQRLLQEGEHVIAPLAVLMTGKFSTAFTSAGMQPPRGMVPINESVLETELFVVGSSRFIQDQFLQMFPANGIFFENAVDTLAQGGRLIGIRSRQNIDRPIGVLTDGMKRTLRYGNVLFGPLGVLTVGIVVVIVRRTKHRRLRLKYSGTP